MRAQINSCFTRIDPRTIEILTAYRAAAHSLQRLNVSIG